MADTFTLSGNLATLPGVPFVSSSSSSQVEVFVVASEPTITDTETNVTRLGTFKTVVDVDGSFTAAGLPSTADGAYMPSGFSYRIAVRYRDAVTGSERRYESNWFALTADTDFADVVSVELTAIDQATYESIIGARDQAVAAAASASQLATSDGQTAANVVGGTLTKAAIDGVVAPVRASLATTIPQALATRSQPATKAQETVLATFGAGHGWTAGANWGSTAINDTTDHALDGAQCVSGVTQGVGLAQSMTVTGVPAFDPTDKWFILWLKTSNPYRISDLRLYLTSSAAGDFTNSAAYAIVDTTAGQDPPDIENNEWFPVVISSDLAITAGTGAGTAVQSLRLRLVDANSGPVTVKFGGLAFFPRPTAKYPSGAVSFGFDDALLGGYTIGLPAMNKYRYRGTAYPVLSQIGTAGGYNLSQLKELQSYGWEVGAHATTWDTHAQGMHNMTADQLAAELRTMKSYLLDNGFHGETLAYPGGHHTTTVRAEALRYFVGARGTRQVKDYLPPMSRARVHARVLTSTVTLATAKALVDRAAASASYLNFVVHDLVTVSTGATYEWTKSDFEALLAYVKSKAMPVLTMKEVITSPLY